MGNPVNANLLLEGKRYSQIINYKNHWGIIANTNIFPSHYFNIVIIQVVGSYLPRLNRHNISVTVRTMVLRMVFFFYYKYTYYNNYTIS